MQIIKLGWRLPWAVIIARSYLKARRIAYINKLFIHKPQGQMEITKWVSDLN